MSKQIIDINIQAYYKSLTFTVMNRFIYQKSIFRYSFLTLKASALSHYTVVIYCYQFWSFEEETALSIVLF